MEVWTLFLIPSWSRNRKYCLINTQTHKWWQYWYSFFLWKNLGSLWTKHGALVKRALWPWAQRSLFMSLFITVGQLPHACLLLFVYEHCLSLPGNKMSQFKFLRILNNTYVWSRVLVCILESGTFRAENPWRQGLLTTPVAPFRIFVRYLSLSLVKKYVITLWDTQQPWPVSKNKRWGKGRKWPFSEYLTMYSQP